MKTLTKYLNEKLIINQQFDEKLIINKDYKDAYTCTPKSFEELRKVIEDRYDKLGPGTEQNPIDFNDIDVSNLDSFCNDKGKGIFNRMKFKYIDISDWNVSNIKSMRCMFFMCTELKSVGDISKWDVSNVTDMYSMFYDCKLFNQDLSGWNVSNVENMWYMFFGCKKFNQDISKWDVYKVRYKIDMFYGCPIKDEYKPKFKK